MDTLTMLHRQEATVIGETVAGEAAATRQLLIEKVNNANKDTFDIAELLHRVNKNRWYLPEFNTLQEFVDTLKIKPRKAQYLRAIASCMEYVGVPRSVYEPLGIARLREIASLDPEGSWTHPETGQVIPMSEFILGFIEKGDTYPMEKLKEQVRTLKGLVGDNDFTWRNLRMKRGAAEQTWDPAIELARKQIGSVRKDEDGVSQDASDGACAEVIAVSFLNDPANQFLAEAA